MDDLHTGHRARLREQFRQSDPAVFPDHVLLELLLSYAIPRRDVNPLAHRLIKAFGSYAAVIGATDEELMSVGGIGKETVTLLHAVYETHNRLLRAPQKTGRKSAILLRNANDVGRYVLSLTGRDRCEVFRLICVDSAQRVVSCDVMSIGSLHSVQVMPRQILEKALFHHAYGVILVHNHPAGNVLPSREDENVFVELTELFRQLDLVLLDSVIAGDRCFFSFARERVYSFQPDGSISGLSPEEYEKTLFAPPKPHSAPVRIDDWL